MVNRTFCSSSGLHRISFVRVCEETFRTVVYSAPEGQRDCRLSRRPKCRHLVLPSVAPPRRPLCVVPVRPARCVFGFGIRQLIIIIASGMAITRIIFIILTTINIITITVRIQNTDTPRAGRFEAAHGGATGHRGAEKDGTPLGRSGQKTPSPLPSSVSGQSLERLCGSTHSLIRP